MNKTKPAIHSKINLKSIVVLIVAAVISKFGLNISAEAQVQIVLIIMMLSESATMLLRTKFSGTPIAGIFKTPEPDPKLLMIVNTDDGANILNQEFIKVIDIVKYAKNNNIQDFAIIRNDTGKTIYNNKIDPENLYAPLDN